MNVYEASAKSVAGTSVGSIALYEGGVQTDIIPIPHLLESTEVSFLFLEEGQPPVRMNNLLSCLGKEGALYAYVCEIWVSGGYWVYRYDRIHVIDYYISKQEGNRRILEV